MRLIVTIFFILFTFSACQKQVGKEAFSTLPLKDGNITTITLFQITAKKVDTMIQAGADFIELIAFGALYGGCKKGSMSLYMKKNYVKAKFHECLLWDGTSNNSYDGTFIFKGDYKNFTASFYNFSVNKKELKEKIYLQSFEQNFSKEGKVKSYYISFAKYAYSNNFILTITHLKWKNIDGELKAYGNIQGAIKIDGGY